MSTRKQKTSILNKIEKEMSESERLFVGTTNYYKIPQSFKLKFATSHAVFLNGYMYVTDGHILIRVSFPALFGASEEQEQILNNVALSKAKLKILSSYKYWFPSFIGMGFAKEDDDLAPIGFVLWDIVGNTNITDYDTLIDGALQKKKDVTNISYNNKYMSLAESCMKTIGGMDDIQVSFTGEAGEIMARKRGYSFKEQVALVMPTSHFD